MRISTDKALQLESEFLAGVESNMRRAQGKTLRGSIWDIGRLDDADRIRSLMARQRKFDRRLLADIPKNQRVVMQSYKRPWYLFGRKRVGVAVASVLSPLEWYVNQTETAQAGPPIGARDLLDHVRDLQIDNRAPHIIGVCSPTGFTPEALETRSPLPNVTLVLVEPTSSGGWLVHGTEDDEDQRILDLFDPEDAPDKVSRVVDHIQAHSAVLLTGGFSAATLAEEMDIPEEIIAEAFEKAAGRDRELHCGRHNGELLLYRGAATDTKESSSMSFVDRIRDLFSGEGDEVRKINELSQRRAALAQRRNRLYDGIIQLEQREADLLEQGRKNKSQVVRRRIAAQLAQLRKDIQRHNASTSMLNKQIDILSTDIHNLTLIQQGQMAELPSTEALTENAVKAEEMLETLQADAEMVGALETGMAESLTSEEELAILDEFEAHDQEQVAELDEPASTTPPESPAIEERPSAATDSDEPQKPAEPEAS